MIVTCVIAKMYPDAFRLFFALLFFLWSILEEDRVSEATKDIAESEDRAVCSISSAKTKSCFSFLFCGDQETITNCLVL